MKIKTFSNEKNALISLFIVELLALTIFNLGNLAWVYRIIAFILATICMIPLSGILKEKKSYKVLVSIGLIYLYAIFSAVFGLVGYSADSITKLSLVIGVGAFFIIGLFIGNFSDEKHINISNILCGFYVGLSLLVGISLMVTIYHYGIPFYHIIYANEPALHEVIQKAYMVIGFNSELVGIQILSNYALILSTGVFGIFFIDNDKKNKTFKIIACVSGLIGIVTILCLAYSMHIYLFIGLACIVYVYKTWNENKLRAKTVALIGIALLVVIIGINAAHRINLLGLKTALNNTNYIRKILLIEFDFGGRLGNIKTALTSISIFGHNSSLVSFKDIRTGNLLLDALYNSGIIAFICLTAFVTLQVVEAVKYFKNYRKNAANILILLIVVTTFGVMMLNSYILSTALDFVLHGILMLLGIMSAQNLKNEKVAKKKTNAKLNEA